MENPPTKVTSLREAFKLYILYELGTNQRVRNAYADLISRYPWEWFVTLTFKDRVHPESARKSLGKWFDILNSKLYTRKWRKKHPYGVYWVLASEYQKRGVLHYHLLLSGVKNAHRLTFMDNWKAMGGKNGYARIEPVKLIRAASLYLTKYVAKGGEIEFSANLPNLKQGLAGLWSDSPNSYIESEIESILPRFCK